MFCYNLYGKLVIINIELPLLSNINDVNKFDLKVDVNFDNIIGDTVSIKKDDEQYLIKLGSLAIYHIDPTNNMITCKARDFESFFSTFFNIPFSVYCLCKDELLFHACSLLHDNKVLCLSGNKGVGKSTLTSILNSNANFYIFGDDTVQISKGLIAKRAHNLIKQTPETVNALNVPTLNVQNVAGKYYSYFDTAERIATIGKIFHLVRSDELKFKIELITSELKKDCIFRANIVGVEHMPYSLINKILKVKPNKEIQFYELIIPNDLNYLIKNMNILTKEILSICDG